MDVYYIDVRMIFDHERDMIREIAPELDINATENQSIVYKAEHGKMCGFLLFKEEEVGNKLRICITECAMANGNTTQSTLNDLHSFLLSIFTDRYLPQDIEIVTE